MVRSIFLLCLVLINTIVRLVFLSSYCPASQYYSGFFKGPCFARIIATMAELIFYYEEARFFGCSFFGLIGFIVVIAEVLCWAHLCFQSELLGWIEDILWTFLQLYIYFSATQNLSYRGIICLSFAFYMTVFHLPRMYKRIQIPLVRKYTSSLISSSDKDTLIWTIPSLLLQVVLYILFVSKRKKNGIDSDRRGNVDR